MAAQYVTVSQRDPDFLKYLWGRVEGGLRALPIRTYNLGTPEESVTFELIDATAIAKPHWIKQLISMIKLRNFILILFPLLYVLVKNWVDGRFFDPLSITLASVAMLFLFAGLNIRNDVNDHISGYDRVNTDPSPRPIRLGWITAQTAARISLALMSFAALLAFPVCLMQPELTRVLAVVLILFFAGRFAGSNSYKQQHLGEFILFLLMGPGLVSGYQVALGAGIDTEILCFGVLWGFAVCYLVQVNNFAHIMTSSQSKIRNSMTRLGFDLAQKFLMLMWIAFIILWAVFHYYFGGLYWLLFGTSLLIIWSQPLFIKISRIKSPVGSGPALIRKEAYRAFMIMVTVSLTQILWFVWT